MKILTTPRMERCIGCHTTGIRDLSRDGNGEWSYQAYPAILFQPDDTIFDTVEFDYDTLATRVRELSYLAAGNESIYFWDWACRPGGLEAGEYALTSYSGKITPWAREAGRVAQQRKAVAAMTPDGGFILVWESNNQDDDGYGAATPEKTLMDSDGKSRELVNQSQA